MGGQFHSDGGEQNIAQGQNAIGKQVNTTQPVSGDNNIFSGTGNVTVNQNVLLKPRTRTILLAAALFGAGFAAWHWLAPAPSPSKSATTTAPNSPAIITDKGNVAVTYNSSSYNVSLDLFEKYVKELNVTDTALVSFFKILEEQKVPRADLDSKLREIATQYKELLARLDSVKSEDPQVVRLKKEAKQAIEAGDYAKAEVLLNQAEVLDLKAIEQMEKTTKQRRISAAATNADQAKLQELQLRYAKAAEYWQRAANVLPEEEKKDKGFYLNAAGYALHRIARYSEALPLYEQSLRISQEIGDKAGAGRELNNIGNIYRKFGKYDEALGYLKQSLAIQQEIGNRYGESATLNGISLIYQAQGDYAVALRYLEQSLPISQEINDREGEGTTLNNISLIHQALGDYVVALNYLKQSLAISQEIGDKAGEGRALSNIAAIHHAQGNYDKALPMFEQSLRIYREIGGKAEEGTLLNNLAAIAYAKNNSAAALKYFEQSLYIRREIGDRRGEAVTSWNIGRIYVKQGDLIKAEPYISHAVQLAEELNHPELEEWNKILKKVRGKLQEQQQNGTLQ